MKYRKLGNTGIDISEIGFGTCGLGDEVSMAIGHMGNAEQFRLGINDAFINNYGTYEEICKSLGLDSDSIAEKVKEIVKK